MRWYTLGIQVAAKVWSVQHGDVNAHGVAIAKVALIQMWSNASSGS